MSGGGRENMSGTEDENKIEEPVRRKPIRSHHQLDVYQFAFEAAIISMLSTMLVFSPALLLKKRNSISNAFI